MLEQLKRNGFAYSPWKMKQVEVDLFLTSLEECDAYNAHVPAKAATFMPLNEAINDPSLPMFSFSMQDVITAPYFFEYALRGYDTALKYFEESPCLYSINAFCTQPSHNEYRDTHSWHRDGDDRKQLAFFMYGTDVNDLNEGAQLYQRESHLDYETEISYTGAILPPETIETITGKAGTMWFVDPRGYHMGMRPNKLRMLVWARWGVSDLPVAYGWNQTVPVNRDLLGDRYPTDPELQKAIRLIIA